MADLIVINTGPLITLARIEALDIAGQLPYEFLCPQEVQNELKEGEIAGYPKVAPSWLKICQLAAPLSPLAVVGLDMGEAAVIQLALERQTARVCIDERKGRRAAQAVGLKITGTLGLLGRAKHLGIIPALWPWVERAIREGIHYDPQLVRKILEATGE